MDNFASELWRLPPPFNMIVLIVAIVFSYSLLSEIATQVRKYLCHQKDVELKRELISQGLSVEEVERVVAAAPPKNHPKSKRKC